ncbi:MAG: hypothetical protein COA75_02950 [Cellvibrionales bacterium]|nr:MAG: hypothetical protein COA75_02950 [Cellvibrionales bacterium]
MFFMLLETVGPVDVEIQSGEGRISEMAEGVESGFREKAISGNDKINKVIFASSIDQKIKFGHSVRDADNRKVTSTVAVVDGAITRAKAGRSFTQSLSQVGAASLYNYIQLSNPAGSGVDLIVTAVSAINYSSASAFIVETGTGELITLEAGAASKNVGDPPDPLIESRSEQSASVMAASNMFVFQGAAGAKLGVGLEDPIVVPQGEHISMRAGVVNNNTWMGMQYHHEAAA